MYEAQEVRKEASGLAEGRADNGLQVVCGSPQRPDSGQSVVAGGTLYGAGLVNSTEPARAKIAEGKTPGNVADVCGNGNTEHSHQCAARKTERLAPMGTQQSLAGDAVHPEGETEVVSDPVSIENVLKLLARQKYRCALTGRPLTPETAALDHIIPIRLGGEHTIENAQVLHKDVNRAKGSLSNSEFIVLCREVVCWAVRPSRKEKQI